MVVVEEVKMVEVVVMRVMRRGCWWGGFGLSARI